MLPAGGKLADIQLVSDRWQQRLCDVIPALISGLQVGWSILPEKKELSPEPPMRVVLSLSEKKCTFLQPESS